MSELLVQVDEQDEVIGSVERLRAHLDDGILHRGLIVVVKNEGNKILLTQRSKARTDLGSTAISRLLGRNHCRAPKVGAD